MKKMPKNWEKINIRCQSTQKVVLNQDWGIATGAVQWPTWTCSKLFKISNVWEEEGLYRLYSDPPEHVQDFQCLEGGAPVWGGGVTVQVPSLPVDRHVKVLPIRFLQVRVVIIFVCAIFNNTAKINESGVMQINYTRFPENIFFPFWIYVQNNLPIWFETLYEQIFSQWVLHRSGGAYTYFTECVILAQPGVC